MFFFTHQKHYIEALFLPFNFSGKHAHREQSHRCKVEDCTRTDEQISYPQRFSDLIRLRVRHHARCAGVLIEPTMD